MKTVWIVERKCDDPYYSPHLEKIFSTEELAIKYVESKKYPSEYLISECEVEESL